MSLLLDALNRASKEKQRAAAAALPPVVPVEPLQWQAVAPTAEPVAVAPEPAPIPPPVPVPLPPPVIAPKVELELALEPSPAKATPAIVQAPSVPMALTVAAVEPMPASVPAPAPEPPSVAAFEPTPVPTPAPIPTPRLEAAAAPAVAKAALPRSAPTLTFKPVPEGQMAQDIRRAYEPQPEPSQGGRRRVLALGGLAVGLALAFGSVFLGLWGDPAKIMGLSGQSSLAMPPNPVASGEVIVAPTPEPARASVDAPVNAAVVAVAAPSLLPNTAPNSAPIPAPKAASDTSSKAAPLPPSVKPATLGTPRTPGTLGIPAATEVASVPATTLVAPLATAAPNNEVVLRGNAANKPAFVAKSRGPGALEQGYAALLDGRLDEAAQAYGQALRANADERDALLGMAYINHQNGRREEAQAYYRKVLRQEPGNAVAIAGLQSLESGTDSTLSAGRASELATRQPDSAAAMAMAGNALVRDGLLADAAQAFARAQALEPSNPLHAYNHAVALDRLGQHAAALAQYDKVLDLSATAPAAVRAYQVEAVRLRVAQLRHALGTAAPVKP